MTPGLRRLYAPDTAAVEADPADVPRAVDGAAVEAVREEWEVDDHWWAPKRLHRRYFDLAFVDGRAAVVFRCEETGRWFRQRA
jgi:hypothetical protein